MYHLKNAFYVESISKAIKIGCSKGYFMRMKGDISLNIQSNLNRGAKIGFKKNPMCPIHFKLATRTIKQYKWKTKLLMICSKMQ